MPRLINLIGKRYGRWTVLDRDKTQRPSKPTYWRCQCTCGTIANVNGAHLRNKLSLSCGCLRTEMHKK